MKPSSAKAKGRKLQQLVRDAILDEFKCSLAPGDVRSTSMGAGGEDVQLSPLARSLFPYAVEAKSKAKIAVYGFYKQAEEHAISLKEDAEPLVVIKQNNDKPLAIVDFEHFMLLTGIAQLFREQQLRDAKEQSKKALLLRKHPVTEVVT